jgi:hypothetical protein
VKTSFTEFCSHAKIHTFQHGTNLLNGYTKLWLGSSPHHSIRCWFFDSSCHPLSVKLSLARSQSRSETACHIACAHCRWPLTLTIASTDLLSIGSSRISKNGKILRQNSIQPPVSCACHSTNLAQPCTLYHSCNSQPQAHGS